MGRPLRGEVRVAARCPCGLPAVVETHPYADGVPFPTLFWLTCRRASSAIGGLEGTGFMRRVNDRLGEDASFREAFDRAQRDYVRRRNELAVLEGSG
ncbi:MAG TPA: DUF501 domain-containing protein, partial [Actinomycetota bacterium]|nr:DUF501 domain-containing protein [Actinomycetota bacterium]